MIEYIIKRDGCKVEFNQEKIADAIAKAFVAVGSPKSRRVSEELAQQVANRVCSDEAIGVPTVIDAARFSPDPALRGLFVCPRDIDETIRCAGRLIAYGVNLAIHPGLTVDDIDALVG